MGIVRGMPPSELFCYFVYLATGGRIPETLVVLPDGVPFNADFLDYTFQEAAASYPDGYWKTPLDVEIDESTCDMDPDIFAEIHMERKSYVEISRASYSAIEMFGKALKESVLNLKKEKKDNEDEYRK